MSIATAIIAAAKLRRSGMSHVFRALKVAKSLWRRPRALDRSPKGSESAGRPRTPDVSRVRCQAPKTCRSYGAWLVLEGDGYRHGAPNGAFTSHLFDPGSDGSGGNRKRVITFA